MHREAKCVVLASIALALAMFGAPTPVQADGATKYDPKCMCRYEGQRYNLGEYACIRSKLARCDMFLNNTTWTFLEDSCGAVKLDAPRHSAPTSTVAGLAPGD